MTKSFRLIYIFVLHTVQKVLALEGTTERVRPWPQAQRL